MDVGKGHTESGLHPEAQPREVPMPGASAHLEDEWGDPASKIPVPLLALGPLKQAGFGLQAAVLEEEDDHTPHAACKRQAQPLRIML
ncbi:Piggybac Transposable Element-Derived Protein 1 [Manis pentadactyla]|nr:Piggybac Transposable Element-Derived Protein 1 [Manis pentadactyla]